jgi:hypothetical protein
MNELFRTPVPVSTINAPIDHTHRILMIGSCFSENIFSKLTVNHFNAQSNPTGIIYNPKSIATILHRLLEGKPYSRDDIFFNAGLWKSFDHHSMFCDPDSDRCLDHINDVFTRAANMIKNTDMVVLTLGSSFVYELKNGGRIVANCHKLPDSNYIRRLLTVDEIVKDCSDVFNKLLYCKSSMRIVMTVSPVRHLRDNPQENSVSKAHLSAAVYTLQHLFDSVYYFPAYEIMLDELRDYRFFAPDMVHPSEVAVDFIWERFRQACIDKRANRFIERYKNIIAARSHNFNFPQSEASKEFRNVQLRLLDQLKVDFPGIDLKNDYDYFRK